MKNYHLMLKNKAQTNTFQFIYEVFIVKRQSKLLGRDLKMHGHLQQTPLVKVQLNVHF